MICGKARVLGLFVALQLLVIGACSVALGAPKVLLSDTFSQNYNNFASSTQWQAKYCSDQWTTGLNGGVSPKTDHGCNCNSGCDFAVYTQGNNKCVNSQAPDNLIVRGDPKWTDYTYSVKFRNDDNDTLGVVFRYHNTANYYLLILSRDIAPGTGACDVSLVGARLMRVASTNGAGKVTILASSNKTYQIGKVQGLQVTALGDQITVHLDSNGDGKFATTEELLFSVKDKTHAQGMIGLYAYQNGAGESPCNKGGCWFDDVLVTEVGPVEPPKPADVDKDGVPDKTDNCVSVANPNQANKDGDAHGDACDGDADGDGISNVAEATAGSNPLDTDSDDDGVLDGDEALPFDDTDKDGVPNIMDHDSDGDGLPDGLEAGVAKPSPDTDVTAGHFISDLDPTTHTSAVKADTDGDGRSDGVEDANSNGRIDACESNPVVVDSDPCSGNPPVDAGSGGVQDADGTGASSADGDNGTSGDTAIAPELDADAGNPGVLDGSTTATGSNPIALKEVGTDDGGCSAAPVDSDAHRYVLLMLGALAMVALRRRSATAPLA